MGKLLDRLRKKHAADGAVVKRHSLNFLAHRNEIEEALKEGWTAKQVWEQMTEDGMIAMSYGSLCRLVKKHITPSMLNANAAAFPASASLEPFPSPEKSSQKHAAPETLQATKPLSELSEQERLDRLKEEAFASVRSKKPTGSLIVKPKTREEEHRELFG